MDNKAKLSLAMSVYEDLETIRKNGNGDINKLLSDYLRSLSNNIAVGEKISNITEITEEVNSAFYDKLLQSYPDLTRTEREICGYIKLDLSNKELAAIRNASIDSIKSAQYRIRKMMGAKNKEELYRILQEIA